jgi:polar amino acid transport system ATP-binding protein/sulfate transport system ATP-binding protein
MATAYTTGDAILQIDDVSLTLGGRPILKNVSGVIHDIQRPGMIQGQIVGLLGPSGVGKTKLFEIMAGLLPPTSGRVLVGSPLVPVQVGRIGVVQQNYPLFNHRTVWGNLMLAASMNGWVPPKEREDKVKDLLNRFKLYPERNHYPAQLSGGQRQRIAIAQQVVCSETYILLDEPFSGLDVNMVQEVSDMLVEVANLSEQNTIILVSHDISSTAAIADTLWVMGRDRDPDGGVIPGAYLKHKYDLMAMDLCWHKDIHMNPKFEELKREIRGVFPSL